MRLPATVLMLMFLSFNATARYPTVSIRQIQQVPLDSLLLADSLQSIHPERWTLQASPYVGDTVTITALCMVPPKTMFFTANGFNMLLLDTGAVTIWGSIFVRVSGDTATAIGDGFLNVVRGDVIRMTGVVTEFPLLSLNSRTEFQPLPGMSIVILATGIPLPEPALVAVDTFSFPFSPNYQNQVRYSAGEQFEGRTVLLRNVVVSSWFGTSGFNVGSSEGPYSEMSIIPLWNPVVRPPVGTMIDSILGPVFTSPGSGGRRGYFLSPVYRGNIVPAPTVPLVYQHHRSPVVVSPDSAPRISATVVKQATGAGISAVSVFYSPNNGPFISAPMGLTGNNIYTGTIPPQGENTFVHYYIRAVDSLGYSAILANSGPPGSTSDSSKGFFFYTSLNRPLTIHDIQYTPFLNGRSGYLGATNVVLSGVVTADTGNIARVPLNTAGTNSWYMQTGIQPWSGIWFDDTSAVAASSVHNGDSVDVTGTVIENFDVTEIKPFSAPVIVHASGRPAPQPVVLATGTFGPGVGNGVPSAEQWEGMLVRFNDVIVTDTTGWTFADPTEYAVDDGSGPILVRRDGVNAFTNQVSDTAGGRRLLRPGYGISFIQGIMYFSFNRYKLVPRTNADFGIITRVEILRDPVVPAAYSLDQNYPNPFNPGTEIGLRLSAYGVVMLKVFDVLGKEVAVLVNEPMAPGKYKVLFDGSRLASGVYYYRLGAGAFVQTKKMLLLR